MPSIVRSVLGRDLNWVAEDAAAFTEADGRLLDEICAGHDVPTELVVRLIDVEQAAHGLKRRHGVHRRIEDVLKQEWRNLDAILAERSLNRPEFEDGVEVVDGDEEALERLDG